jgi:hypothetical protein
LEAGEVNSGAAASEEVKAAGRVVEDEEVDAVEADTAAVTRAVGEARVVLMEEKVVGTEDLVDSEASAATAVLVEGRAVSRLQNRVCRFRWLE